jgi:hypothetical protein
MASGDFHSTVLVDNDQIVTVYLCMHHATIPAADKEILISYTTDIASYNPNITNPSTQVELVLTNAIYSLRSDNNTKAELSISYEVVGATTDETIILIPSNASEISFNKGIGKNVLMDNTKNFTGNITYNTHNKPISGYAVLTFYKKSGFLRNSKKYRKATQANPYSN